MGDYGFGLLVQTNNTNSKVAFPVRYHQPHQQQHSQSATAAAGFCSAAAAAVTGSAWLFPASAAQTMQDDLLLSEKSKSQQQQQQQQLSPRLDQAASEAVILPESPKSEEENQSIGNGGGASVSTSNCKDKLRMESPILSGFDYHEPPSGLGGAGTSGGAPSLTSTSSLTGFSNWSAAMTPPTMSEDNFFHQGVPAASPNGTMLFQNFPHHVSSGFGGSYSPQMALSQHHHPHPPPPPPHHHHQQQQRRSPASPHPAPFPHRNAFNHLPHLVNSISKPPSPWNSYQSPSPSSSSSSSWSSGGGVGVWGGSQGRDHRRGMAGGMAALNSISPMKKPFPGGHIPAHKFSRSSTAFPPKSWMEDGMLRNDNILPFQDRTRLYDTLNMHSLESSLIDIMRAEQDPLKGRLNYTHPGSDSPLPINGHSSLFPVEDSFLDDGRGDQSLHSGLNSPHCFPHQNGERVERYSRKVFVGGLPPDIDEDEITASFRRFGSLVVDWPHKAESKSYFPPKGYAFLLFQEEGSVQALIDACIEEDGKLYLCVSSPTIKDKPVQIRPWNLNDSDFVMDGSQPLDPRKTIFVGGVPRPLRAVELAMIMDRLYGGVCYAGIDTDPELKYPKGAGRVAFSNQQSYIAAISARFVQLQHGDIDKRVEVKPYVLDDQLCDECQGTRCGGKFAPFFCANVTCLQYYCEYCWAAIHSRAGREFHKPLVKEGGDRPRQVPFRWN
ncbi:cytoplasmic polyadenylation element-binding protein 4b isoform X2 [Callorhinchus milii]|uniref:cytoplasmic polyadenylation element-binding protein 4b isoform X2 n=1 Tax=Callorhinchus milii TaxID=7868 RepID=UPI000457403B|nr:cytoplasmic polyadenylation element-binding protein 4b isoform X2 [Callorhinchus milii]|eukprot:gi/632976529/ref/XP_007904846.1/ PREDICTED: cytoplasmic polyadenylation element-binding protein 4 [Callorhinchus milii]